MVIFWLKWKETLLMLNYCDYFLGNFWKKLGYFLVQHLVTLTWTREDINADGKLKGVSARV